MHAYSAGDPSKNHVKRRNGVRVESTAGGPNICDINIRRLSFMLFCHRLEAIANFLPHFKTQR